MLRTALACALVLLLGYGAARWMTHDFQVFTDEGARRLEVALRPVPVPTVTVHGPGIAPVELPALLAEGGGVTVADFFYANCRTVCLALGNRFQQMQRALEADDAAPGRAPVRLLSISFDGARDDPAALDAYARQLMRANPALWRFASVPDPREQVRLMRALGVVAIPDGWGEFEHNAALLVFDARGRMVRVFDLDEMQLALDYARHLAARGSL